MPNVQAKRVVGCTHCSYPCIMHHRTSQQRAAPHRRAESRSAPPPPAPPAPSLQVMAVEYLSGGELLDHLHLVTHYSEAQAAALFAQVGGLEAAPPPPDGAPTPPLWHCAARGLKWGGKGERAQRRQAGGVGRWCGRSWRRDAPGALAPLTPCPHTIVHTRLPLPQQSKTMRTA